MFTRFPTFEDVKLLKVQLNGTLGRKPVMATSLASDDDVRRLLGAYRMKRRRILSEMERAKCQPERAAWPIWEGA
jgi:hypothetical protein